ncbi:helix-turn-helix domain-containing protein [cf. Phormidesmis sp. LEGE 11477]|uniref:helix-turn-helix domain-containing protein n=1 Tax=cf. Phormidesmis sp. LEGE 11477 TaxID=1828680 RepID=UPI001882BE33|nr:helix-turn-helix domain-containing protein [cf. Phormidesmis sp. LEGE 11477]MBE9062999.1 helix-turn-helix domain-containing protein [cf. Phormidesmis sp. LEGE 11477]
MPKRIFLADHLTTYELKSRYQSSKDIVELRRWHLLWLVAEGWTLTDAAGIVALNYHYAREIVQSYNKLGAAGVRNRRKDSVQ